MGASTAFDAFRGSGCTPVNGNALAKLCKDGLRPTTGDQVLILDGSNKGKVGNIVRDDGPNDMTPYRVEFRGGEQGWYEEASVKKDESIAVITDQSLKRHNERLPSKGALRLPSSGAGERQLPTQKRAPSKEGGSRQSSKSSVPERRQSSKLSVLGSRQSSKSSLSGSRRSSRSSTATDDGCFDRAHAGSGFRAVRNLRRSQSVAGIDDDSTFASSGEDRSPPPQLAATLSRVFALFAGPHGDMDGKSFMKLCKDCNLLNKNFTQADADLTFALALAKGQKRISLHQFDVLLCAVADSNGMTDDEVRTLVALFAVWARI